MIFLQRSASCIYSIVYTIAAFSIQSMQHPKSAGDIIINGGMQEKALKLNQGTVFGLFAPTGVCTTHDYILSPYINCTNDANSTSLVVFM